MSFFTFLDRLRTRSESERQAIAFGTAGIIAGAVFVAWLLVTIPDADSRFTEGESSGQEAAAGSLEAAPERR